jgi:hypothetical protein
MRALAWVLGLSLLIVAGAAAQQASNLSGDEIKALQQRLAAGGCYRGALDGQASGALAEAIKACPSQDPILRIETGMHVAKGSRREYDRYRLGRRNRGAHTDDATTGYNDGDLAADEVGCHCR